MTAITAILRFFSSLRLAVIVIISLGVVAAVGTILEARYNDSEAAQQLVYRSPYMYAVLGLLCLNLIGVMISRWPWERRHAPFVCAHVGIIMLLMGAFITQKQGIDGSLIFEPGQSQRYITVKNRDLTVYATMDGNDVRPIFEQEVNFLVHPPKEHPLKIDAGSESLEIVDYYNYAYRQSETVASDRPIDGPAVRFQIENDRVNLTEWLRRETRKAFVSLNLGPAQVVLSDGSYKPAGGQNEIVLAPGPNGSSLHYSIYLHGLLGKRGIIRQSEAIETGWMGLKFHLLRYLPRAKENVTYQPVERMTDQTESAVAVRFQGETHWVGLNSILRLYGGDRMYIVSYGHRRIPLDFALTLKDFRVGRYQGTERAASYESDVEVPGRGLVTISMNQPLKMNGFTFYQASFEQDAAGKPTASVLSVNYDPGRWIKYFGSFLLVFGSSLLFWFRKLFYKRQAPSKEAV